MATLRSPPIVSRSPGVDRARLPELAGERSRLATPIVLGAWSVLTALLVARVVRHGTAMPSLDDLHMVELAGGALPISWDRLWAQHNEHRIPLPKLVYALLVGGARDFRAGTWLDVALISATALAQVFLVARQRGRVAVSDALIPCLWLHGGHAENQLNSFQVCFALPVAISTALLAIATWSARPPGVARVLSFSALLLLLAGCGTVGVVQVPVFCAWLAYAGLASLRRGAALAALSGCLLALAACAAYFAGFGLLAHFERPSLARAARTAVQFATQGLGVLGQELWPWSGAVVVLATSVSLLALVAVAVRDRSERVRASGWIACSVAAILVAASIGWGRSMDSENAGWLSRYGWLADVLLVCAYAGWSLHGPRPRSAFASAFDGLALAAAGAWIVVANVAFGERYGTDRVAAAQAFERDLGSGEKLRAVAARHWRSFFYGERIFFDAVLEMRRAGLGPFRRPVEEVTREREYPMLRNEPTSVESAAVPLARAVDGRPVLVVLAPAELRFSVGVPARAVRGICGVFPPAFARERCDGTSFEVEWAGDDGTRELLAAWRVDPPVRGEVELALRDFEVPLAGRSMGEIVLRVSDAEGKTGFDWALWSDVEVRFGD